MLRLALLPQALLLVGSLLTAAASAQSGTLDQEAPDTGATFSLLSSTIVWQQEVRVGFGGQLTDVEVTVEGSAGMTFVLRVRRGGGWSVTEPLFEQTITLAASGLQDVLVDVTAAGIFAGATGPLAIELQGNGDLVFARGSHVPAGTGSPLYPFPLYLLGPTCFNDCGWRLAFRTFVDPNDGPIPYCSSTPNSTGGAAVMSTAGSSSLAANDLQLVATPVPNEPGLFLMGRSQADLPLGPGTLCVALPFHRLQFGFGVNNVMTFDVDLGNLPLAYQVLAGDAWNFQCYYRDPTVSPFYNLSDAIQVLFVP